MEPGGQKVIIYLEDMRKIDLSSLGILPILLQHGNKWELNPRMLPRALVFNANLGKNEALHNHKRFLRSLTTDRNKAQIPNDDSDMHDLTSSMQSLVSRDYESSGANRKRRDIDDDYADAGGEGSSWLGSADGRRKRGTR